jgi:hypothetical protein
MEAVENYCKLQTTGTEGITMDSADNTTGQGNTSPNTPEKVKSKKHKTKIPTIDINALKELEGSTTSSFLDLAKAVILIDGIPYDETTLPLSKARKIDFERLIAHHAQLEIYGKRRYHIKCVVKRKAKEESNDVELVIKKKSPYSKAKPPTEAQREARRKLYLAKKEIRKRAIERQAEDEKKKTEEKIAELEKQAMSNNVE